MANNILKFWTSLDSDDPMEPLFSAAPILMHSIDKTGVLVRVSQFWADKLGYKVEDMVGRPSVEFLTEASQAYAKQVLPRFFETGSIENIPYDFICRDGSTLPVLMSAIAEYEEDGSFRRSLAVLFDNTEATRAADALRRKQRLEATGALVGGVAHDFNNLLEVIQGNLGFLQSNPDHPNRAEMIADAHDATRRGAVLTQQLLTYGRKAQLLPEETSVNAIVASADRMVSRLLPANITLQTQLADNLWPVHVDPGLLETALLNILNNARDAMDHGGHIRIETSVQQIPEPDLDGWGEAIPPGRYVLVSVTDTGNGIEKSTLERIFDPFFTTKAVGKGSGLGLSMVIGFMRQSGGGLKVQSAPGAGTRFELYFPAVQDAPSPEAPGPADAPPQAPSATVLLAEDQPEVRRVLIRQLEDAGFDVVSASSGDEALRLLRDGLAPDVLATDITMPGHVQGAELADEAQKMNPAIKVLFLSGNLADSTPDDDAPVAGRKSLMKPVDPGVLIATLDALLSGQ